jgi:hypothetical protein
MGATTVVRTDTDTGTTSAIASVTICITIGGPGAIEPGHPPCSLLPW